MSKVLYFQAPWNERKSNIAKGQPRQSTLTEAFETWVSHVSNFIVEVIVQNLAIPLNFVFFPIDEVHIQPCLPLLDRCFLFVLP